MGSSKSPPSEHVNNIRGIHTLFLLSLVDHFSKSYCLFTFLKELRIVLTNNNRVGVNDLNFVAMSLECHDISSYSLGLTAVSIS